MYPTLEDQDRVVVISHWPNKWLCRGMIVVAKSPIYLTFTNKHSQMLLVKRIVGLPGDKVITNTNDEMQTLGQCKEEYYVDSNGERTWLIPPHHFFLKGDSSGTDSDILGPLPYKSLIGVVAMRLWNGRNNKMM